ncbi:MAG: DUF3883 domain-containing protein [Acidobacteria bacterium]|nr:DUF3883 domain-containing protein [Acidobacteriota bacterium]
MAKNYTVYWTNSEFKRIKNSNDPYIQYAFGNQLKKVQPGDILWILSYTKNDGLLLIGKIVVGREVGHAEARRIFGGRPWSQYGVAADEQTMEMFREISLNNEISKLRFISKTNDRLKYDGSFFDAQQLRAVRELTTNSASRLNSLWSSDKGRISDTAKIINSTGGGFGTPENNKKVEISAIKHVIQYLKARNWKVASVEADRKGYDLSCQKGHQKMHIEVKGISGSEVAFIITNGEMIRAQQDGNFYIYAVTDATSNPKIHIYDCIQLTEKFEIIPIAFRVFKKQSR